MPQYNATSSVDINQVGAGWVNANIKNYLAGLIPSGDVLGSKNDVDVTNYKLSAYDNFLQKGELKNWKRGQALPGRSKLAEVAVVVTPVGRGTETLGRDADRPMEGRWEDLSKNIVPGLLSKTYQGVDKAIATFLKGSSNFGQISITGTGALDTFATDQRPFWDILKKGVAPIRKYADSREFFEKWMIVDQNVMDVFMSHFNLNPMGVGAAISGRAFAGGQAVTTEEMIVALFKSVLRLDRVILTKAIGDTAAEGQTSVPQEISYGVCWFGAVDIRPWDLSGKDPNGAKPDGALQLAWSRRPEVKNGIVTLSEEETFVGRAGFQVYSPRGPAWGKLLPVASIFT